MEKIIKDLDELNSFFAGLKELAIRMNEVEKILDDVKPEENVHHAKRKHHKKRKFKW